MSNEQTSWKDSQIIRLAAERKMLKELFSEAEIFKPKDNLNAYALLDGNTTSGIGYELKSPIPSDFPNSMLKLYLLKPNPLPSYDKKFNLNSLGLSHDFHMRGPGPNNCVSICWTGNWHPGMTIAKCFSSGIAWMQCYQIHTKTGETIEEILRRFKGREQDLFNQG